MQKRILIVTNVSDVHADIVEHKLRDKGASPFRINLDEFPKNFTIDIGFGSNGLSGTLCDLHSSDPISLDEVGAVWIRKSAKFCFISDDLATQEQAFAQSETEHLFFSLLYSIDCFWMSHPLATRGSLWKGEQLRRAAQMGFQVPRSIISNCPDSVRHFKRTLDREIIFKTMSSPSLCAEDVAQVDRKFDGLPTTRVSDDHFEAIDSVRELPCLFQEYVQKKYELRVTVIGNKVFAAKIYSQNDSRTETDYRDFSVDIPYELATLSDDVKNLCLKFVRSYGLEFGAMDLIVTPKDEIVFLENNPGGQFLFVEQLVPELRMTDAVSDLLLSQVAVER